MADDVSRALYAEALNLIIIHTSGVRVNARPGGRGDVGGGDGTVRNL